MSRGPSTFRQRDVTAAIKAAKAAGMEVGSVEIGKDGKIVVVSVREMSPESDSTGWEGARL